MKKENSKIIVVCQKCGAFALYQNGEWLWHQPCQKCGAEDYGSEQVKPNRMDDNPFSK